VLELLLIGNNCVLNDRCIVYTKYLHYNNIHKTIYILDEKWWLVLEYGLHMINYIYIYIYMDNASVKEFI
jgi:hypothetical protein